MNNEPLSQIVVPKSFNLLNLDRYRYIAAATISI
jgi:hypothetical protein